MIARAKAVLANPGFETVHGEDDLPGSLVQARDTIRTTVMGKIRENDLQDFTIKTYYLKRHSTFIGITRQLMDKQSIKSVQVWCPTRYKQDVFPVEL